MEMIGMAANENCVIRMGGLGDLAILSSSLLALSLKEPWRPLVLATRPQNIDLLDGAEYLSRVITIPEAEKEEWFRVYDCRWGVEPPTIGPGRTSWESYTSRDRSDIFDDLLGIRNGHKRFSIPLDYGAQAKLRDDGIVANQAIGIAPTSRSPVRCMPPEYVGPLVQTLVKGNPVVLFGKTEVWWPQIAEISGQGIINLIDKLTVKEMVALISLMKVVITPDTAVYHIAAALGVKSLALFGNIHPNTRTTYYPTVTSLYPSQEEFKQIGCKPCWDVPRACNITPPGTFGAPCMRLFTPERIVTELILVRRVHVDLQAGRRPLLPGVRTAMEKIL